MPLRNKQPQIGDHVTLISSLEVRYEGVLFTIDPNESTVALQNVRCLGTEDRQPPGEKAIAKSDETYQFIIFRGVNIKSISCMDKGSKSPERPPINDPSILKVGQPTMRRTDRHNQNKNTNVSTRLQQRSFRSQRNNYQDNRFQGSYEAPRGQWQPTQNQGHRNYNQGGRNRYNQGPRNYRRGAGRSNYRGRGNYRWQNRRNPDFAPGSGKFLTQADHAPVESTMKKDFNFEENNKRFDKDKYLEEAKQKDEAEAEKVKEKLAKAAEENAQKEEKETDGEVKKGDGENDDTGKQEESGKKEESGEDNKADPTKNTGSADDKKDEVGQKQPQQRRQRTSKPMAEALKMGTESKYDPNNFFDELDDGRQPPEHADAQKRRAKDVSTFGEVAQTYSPKVFRRRKYRGRGGWRGRRGRGRYNYYRGRGRYYNYVQH